MKSVSHSTFYFRRNEMRTKKGLLFSIAAVVVAGFMLQSFSALPAEAQTSDERMVREATKNLKLALDIPRRDVRDRLLRKAKAVAILPGTLSGGFIFGAKHGRGIVISKDRSGKWAGPVREITITEGKVGFLAGIKVTDLVLFFMTSNSVEEIKTGRVTLGGTASIAAGPVGREGEAGITFTSAVYSYTRTKGVYAGASVKAGALLVGSEPLHAPAETKKLISVLEEKKMK
jgi:lipid-binding SYLF domain-containing protein